MYESTSTLFYYTAIVFRLLSMFGVCLCLALMIMSSWYYTIAALLLAAGIYKYIEYKGLVDEIAIGIISADIIKLTYISPY